MIHNKNNLKEHKKLLLCLKNNLKRSNQNKRIKLQQFNSNKMKRFQ